MYLTSLYFYILIQNVVFNYNYHIIVTNYNNSITNLIFKLKIKQKVTILHSPREHFFLAQPNEH